MENGIIQSVDRTNWDLGFYTNAFSAGIIINDGNGVVLATYPNADTNGWDAIDTTGLSTWPKLYNSTDIWEDGAFNIAANGHPDYGWGIYNMVTHNLTGDSIYIMKIADGSFKKLWIVKKLSGMNIYKFRYANLDGTGLVEETLDCNPYVDKNFVYYSMADQLVRDREPASDTWDILFTKYNEVLEEGSNYLVTGALTNVNVDGNKFEMVDPAFDNWQEIPFDSSKNVIGYDWKEFTGFTTGWIVYDSTLFFVKDLSGNVYKLQFLTWEGSMTGIFSFEKSLASPAGISDISAKPEFQLYPNPASGFLTIEFPESVNMNQIQILDPAGKVVYEKQTNSGTNRIKVSDLVPGVYLVTVKDESGSSVQKLLIR
jgi:hypothetical protein